MSKFKLLLTSLFVALFLVIPSSVLAYNAAVLGEATPSASTDIGPTHSGPGLILPDSHFFFLDEWKQQLRLFFAFTPEHKAKVHMAIAGERLAELRIMLLRNNSKGIRVGLAGISSNLTDAADSLYQAQLSGRDVKELAKQINTGIKADQDVLDELAMQSTGDLRAQVNLAQSIAFKAKVRVEDALPNELKQTEILDDLVRRAAEQVQQSSDASDSIQITLDELNKQTEALATSSSKISTARILQLQAAAIAQAKAAAASSKNAAANFKDASEAINALRVKTASSSSK